MTKQMISFCIAVIIVPAVLLGWSILAHNVRVWRVRKLARSLPVGTRERILARIAEAARGSSVCTLLIPVDSVRDNSPNEALSDGRSLSPQTSQPDITASRFGGTPYGEAGEQWPTRGDGSEVPADFLIQVRLDEALPSPWPGRLIVVFRQFDPHQTVLVYASPSPDKYACRPGRPDGRPACGLMPLPIPNANPPSNEQPLDPVAATESSVATQPPEYVWQLPYDPSLLIDIVPGLRDELRSFTRQPADLLAQLLAPNHYGYGFDLGDIVQLGGGPQWVQNDPGPLTCTACGQPLRFLFQFGDLSGQNRLGDAGVCYVFGCDAHPDHVQSVVQMY